MPDHSVVTFRCPCGEQVFWEDDLRDNEVVTCQNCGRKGPTLGSLKKAALDATKKAVEKITGKGIKWD